jgi:predicted ATP-grasp superfamily ATP-dependent carboligase
MPTARKPPAQLKLKPRPPQLQNATLLLALTGWMDGGDVSTGSVRAIMGRREVRQVARIEPDDFYIYNFPGSMEIAAMFRPHVAYDEGVVTEFDLPSNVFWADEADNLVFFVGREPNLRWQAFADCVFHLIRTAGVSRIIFMGSFGGSVPHTREPRLYGSVSDRRLRDLLKQHGLRPSEYAGPGSFATMLLHEAKRHEVEMLSLVAEIPAYLAPASADHWPADRPRVHARDQQRLGEPRDRGRGEGREARGDDPQVGGGIRQRPDQPGGVTAARTPAT